jgi:hypothetical protein
MDTEGKCSLGIKTFFSVDSNLIITFPFRISTFVCTGAAGVALVYSQSSVAAASKPDIFKFMAEPISPPSVLANEDDIKAKMELMIMKTQVIFSRKYIFQLYF